MRKILLFAFLFGVGLSALLYFDRQRKEESAGSQGAGPVSPLGVGPAAQEGQTPDADPGGGTDQGTGQDPQNDGRAPERGPISGRQEFSHHDLVTGNLEHSLLIEDLQSRKEGDILRYSGTGVTLRVLDPVSGTEQRRADAARAEFGIDFSESIGSDLGALFLSEEGRVLLYDVVLVQSVDHPNAPVTVTAPVLEASLDLEEVRSVGDGEVVVDGTGLDGRGVGFEARKVPERLAFLRGGRVDLQEPSGRTAHFESTGGGPLVVERRDSGGLAGLFASAEQGARLQLDADPAQRQPAVDVRASSMELHGRAVDGGVRLERGEARGTVVCLRAPDRYIGESASVVFDGEGRLRKLELDEDPEVIASLRDREGHPQEVTVRGAGPLVVNSINAAGEYEAGAFEFSGPATVEVPGLSVQIRTEGTLSAAGDRELSDGSERIEFEARGPTVLRQGVSFAETESLVVTLMGGDSDALDAVARGPSKAQGHDSSGSFLEVSSEELIELRVRGEVWTIPKATRVSARTLSGPTWEVHAGELRDFDWAERSFVASDGVTWSGPQGHGSAQRVEALSATEARFEGSRDAPAELVLTPESIEQDRTGVQEASFHARLIVMTEVHVEATGDVVARVQTKRQRFVLHGAFVRLDAPEAPMGPTPFALRGEELTEARIVEPERKVILSCELLTASGEVRTGSDGRSEVVDGEVIAAGDVEMQLEGSWSMEASAHRVILSGEDHVILESQPPQAQPPQPQPDEQEHGGDEPEGGPRLSARAVQERVHAHGLLPGVGLPFTLDAKRIEARPERVEALAPHLVIDATLMPIGGVEAGVTGVTTIDAGRFVADATGLVFEDRVRLRGADEGGVPVSLDAGTVQVKGSFEKKPESGQWQEALELFQADGGFVVVYGGLGRGRGTRLTAGPRYILLEGTPTLLEMGEHSVESGRIEADLVDFLISCDRGVIRGGTDQARWSMEFAGITPVERGEETLFVVGSPVYTELDITARADWASFWIFQQAWRERGERALFRAPLPMLDPDAAPPPPVRPAAPVAQRPPIMQKFFRKLGQGELPRYGRAVLLEGNIEVNQGGRQAARMERMFLDIEERSGWLENAELSFATALRGENRQARLRAERFETTVQGALIADKALITACDHEEPHYVVETGEFRLEPRDDGRWRLNARHNKVVFRHGIQIPLPPIRNVVLDEGGGFEGFETESGDVATLDNLAFGNTPRGGTFLGARGAFDIDKWGRKIGSLFGFDETKVRGKWKYEASYLSSRGPLAGLGLQLREKGRQHSEREEFWLDLWARGIPDEGRDRGFLRVPEAEAPSLRGWLHAAGRYPLSDREWFDVRFNTQTDPGVQSEFWEREYVYFEERDNFLHWRNAPDGHYFDATYRWRQDSYRAEVEEKPSLGAYRGAATIGYLGDWPIMYGGGITAAILRRRSGDDRFEPEPLDIFGNVDTLGTREVLRVDTSHKLEMPISTGYQGIRATPFLTARASAWDQGVDPNTSPARVGLFGGMELSTALLKSWYDGSWHTLAPVVRYSAELALEESDGVPVRFDPRDDPINGNSADIGLRSIWRRPGTPERLDLEFTWSDLTNRGPQLPDRQGFSTLGSFRTELGGTPVAVIHDGRVDPEHRRTLYSQTIFAVKPTDSFLMEFGHWRARAFEGGGLYEAASIRSRFKISQKWEFDVANTISIQNGGTLGYEVVLRRFSHDFLLELAVSDRAGEGTSFQIDFAPLLAWRRPRMGILDDGR